MIHWRLYLDFTFFGQVLSGLLQGRKAVFDGIQYAGFVMWEAITGRQSHVLFHVALLIELRCCFSSFGHFIIGCNGRQLDWQVLFEVFDSSAVHLLALVEFVHFALFDAAWVLKQLLGELVVLSHDAFILALADHNVHRLGVECGLLLVLVHCRPVGADHFALGDVNKLSEQLFVFVV